MRRLANRIRLLPKIIKLASHAPRNPGVGWERYWTSVGAGDAEILWDSGRHDEGRPYEELIRRHLDTNLPIVDVGCGNGPWTRWLAERFPRALGIDLSVSAVGQAARESAGVPNAEFDAVDALAEGAGAAVRERLGEANVFVRGVFHILKPEAQHRLAATLHEVVGVRGRVLLTETNFRGSGLAYIEHLGATGDHIPVPLRKAIETLPPPKPFGAPELRRAFPDAEWRLLEERDVVIETVPMAEPGVPERIPGYCAVLARR